MRVQYLDTKALVAGDNFEQIGSTLKHARRLQGLKISDVSQHLRISVDYLSKLESGTFDQLPAPAYIKGFLRSYGQFVALDPSTLVARYTALTAKTAAMPTYKMPMCTRPPQRSAPAIASMLVVCAGIAYGGWYWGNGGDVNDQMAMAPSEIVETPSIPAAMQDTLIDQRARSAIPNDDQAQSQNLKAPAAQPEKVIAAKAVMPTPSVVIADPVAKTKNVIMKMPPVASANPVEIVAAIIAPREPAAPPADLDSPVLSGDLIRAVAASWVEIVRDNGEEVMAKLMQAGDRYVVDGNTRLYLSTGNAGGLQIVIGSDDPRPIGETGQIVRDLPLITDKLRQTL